MYIKRFAIHLDFLLNNHIAKTNKQRRHAGNNCTTVSRLGYIWIWSGTRDQKSTNHSAHCVKFKSSYTTNNIANLTIWPEFQSCVNAACSRISLCFLPNYREAWNRDYCKMQICFNRKNQSSLICWQTSHSKITLPSVPKSELGPQF